MPEKKIYPSDPDRMTAFQNYIFNLSALFIAIPAVNVAAEINKRLGEIGIFWDFEQIFLAQFTHGGSMLTTTYAYNAPGVAAAPKQVKTAALPWLMNIIQSGRPEAMYDVLEDLPESALADAEKVKALGIKSALILPFIVGGSVQGGLFFNSIHRHREYPPELIKELQRLGQILAGALERLKAFDQIRHSMRFDRLLSEMSATYINLSPNEIISSIQKDLGRLGLFLQVDRCVFYRPGGKKGTYQIDDPFNWWVEEDTENIRRLQRWVKANPDLFDHYRYCFDKWNRGEVLQYAGLDELPPEAEPLRRIHEKFGNRSWLSVPISVGGSIVGALAVATIREHRVWPEALIPRLRLFGEIFANAIKRREHEASLKKAFLEIKNLKQQIEADYVYLRDELTLAHNYGEIIGQSDALKAVLFKVEKVAPTDANVLILGETGTGKELIARAIHNGSSRSTRPLIKVNCAALTPNLIESELFGHEKGAFTGADKRRVGRFELAHGATLFLDEIGELPMELQPKLLRVLQEGEFERLGGSRTLKVDVRIIAATNRDLEKQVDEGRFRSDLWYRLNSFPILLPPLRERLEDMPLFVNYFVNQYCSKLGRRFRRIPKKIIENLSRYSWPGNIRELDNIIARAVITSSEERLEVQIPQSPQASTPKRKTFREMERGFLLQTLKETRWKIEGPTGAAQKLDLKPSTLRNKMRRLNITRPDS